MAFGYSGNYFATKGIFNEGTHVELKNSSGIVIDEKPVTLEHTYNNGIWVITLAEEVVFDVLEGDEIDRVSLNSTNLSPALTEDYEWLQTDSTIETEDISQSGTCSTSGDVGNTQIECAESDGQWLCTHSECVSSSDEDLPYRKHLGTGSLPTETADRDGTYTLESLTMYLN